MPGKLFVDTSCFFAFLNRGDVNHIKAVEYLKAHPKKVTSNYVFDELMALLTSRGQKNLSLTFGEELREKKWGDYYYVTLSDEKKAWDLYKKFHDHPLSFTDCTTLLLLKEKKVSLLASFDQGLIKASSSLIKQNQLTPFLDIL